MIALTRLAFGASLSDSEGWGAAAGATDADKFASWVNTQLNPDFAADTDCNARIASANLVSLGKTLPQLWSDYMRNPTQNKDFNREDPANHVYWATFLRAIYSKWQLFEVLVDFWANHFNVYAWDDEYASTTWVHYNRDVIRAHALGNFRQMLESVAKSPAMLFYLDNYSNSNAGPNENWAREMIELHTMGTENYAGVVPRETVPGYPGAPVKYCDGDVYETTRCFTGWRVNDEIVTGDANFKDDGTYLYDASRHDRFQKIVLGTSFSETWANTPEKDGQTVMDKVASHPGCGNFIVRKLWRRLIGDTVPVPGVPNAFFDAVAKTFTDNWQAPNQIQLVVQQLLLGVPAQGANPAIPSPFATTFGDKIKRPLEAAVSMLRATGASLTPRSDFWDFFNVYSSMGQDLFARRSPDGYPDVKQAWNNTTSILMRWRFANWLMDQGTSTNNTGVKVDLASITLAAFPTLATRTPNAVADYWISRILGRAVNNAETHKAVVDMLALGDNPATYTLTDKDVQVRAPDAIALILMCPDFQLR